MTLDISDGLFKSQHYSKPGSSSQAVAASSQAGQSALPVK